MSIAVPLYATVTTRSRIAKAQADIRSLVTAVSTYQAHMSVLPSALADLTAVVTGPSGLTAGPFMGSIPPPPSPAWGSAYTHPTPPPRTFPLSAPPRGPPP